MIGQTLSFGSPGLLSVLHEQLVWNGANNVNRAFPIEDLAYVILDCGQISITAHALYKLAAANVTIVHCDCKHLPVAQTINYVAHTTAQAIVSAQLMATRAVNGRLWRQIVIQKIRNQAALMERLKICGAKRLWVLSEETKNYDETNSEAQAARIYFQGLMPEVKRDSDGEWPNAALNYGYAVLRAAMARALVGSGLLCLRGIHHHCQFDSMCLADDMMEPYRPFVDQYVFGKIRPFDIPAKELTKEMRARLLEMLACDVRLGAVRRPLMVALTYTSASLARYYLGKAETLALPEFT